MQETYSEVLRRSQREGLRAAEEQRLARQAMLAARAGAMPAGDGPGGAREAQPPDAAGEAREADAANAAGAAGIAGIAGIAGAGQGTAAGQTSEAGQGEDAAQRPPRPARWADADVVACRTCHYWRPLDEIIPLMACCYPLIEGKLRPCRPADCYLHEGTPYRPIAQRVQHSVW